MNRTKDGRFRTTRVKLSRKDCENLLLRIKNAREWTWKEFADHLGVSEHTLSHEWKSSKSTLPEPIFRKLTQLSKEPFQRKTTPLAKWWGQSKGNKSKFNDLITLPAVDSAEFAEFFGAMIGDGCIYKNMTSLCISCNGVLDKWYVDNHLKNLCISLFNITPKIYHYRENKVIRLVINSTKLTKFINGIGFPAGKKKQSKFKIPKIFFRDKKLLAACLRGIVDTDGGIYKHPNTRIMLSVTSISPDLLNSIHKGMRKVKINAGMTRNTIRLYGSDKLKKYFKLIGSSNPRNIVKYKIFLKKGKVPNTIETERLLNGGYNKIDIPYKGPMV